MDSSKTMKLLLICAFSAVSAYASTEQEFQFQILSSDVEHVLNFAEPPTRRSALSVEETDAKVKATAQKDNNEALLPLFGPDLITVSQRTGRSYCNVISILVQDYCNAGEHTKLFQTICPISCSQPAEEFCVQDDALAAFYAQAINLKGLDYTSCAAMETSFGPWKTIFHPDNQLFLFCEHPALGLMCSETCQINCWSWPPPETTKVYLPDCKRTVAVPDQYYPPQMNNRAPDGSPLTTICPP